MQERINIWSSVVVARLPEKKICQHTRECRTAVGFRRIEEMKTRISARQVTCKGRAAELKVNVETLFVMEDEQGNLLPFSRRDIITESVALTEFLPQLEAGQELVYVAEIKAFNGDSILRDQNLIITYDMTFMLLALREQIVSLQPERIGQANLTGLNPADENLFNASQRENIDLRRQIRIYEMNLLSLKKSLQKAETVNAELQRQIRLLRQAEEAFVIPRNMDESKQRKSKNDEGKIISFYTREERRKQMGKKIKEFFINNA
ncbi:MAG TPA: hypothetical protein PLC88_00580 [Syntrophomonas sp.]|nr:hypothetical protein [Syntrophomonas sp.]HRW12819.1 hypothetical protein [Syntrophomonas sp.]